ncbi:MAG: hypothetical protein GDA35_09970 [Hyphomonadaceae bacterium]|nr:hypothetical protein [Hyphomonadaceae bacterium]
MKLKSITLIVFWGSLIVPFVLDFFVTDDVITLLQVTFLVSFFLIFYPSWALYISRNTTDKVEDRKKRKKMKTYVTVSLVGWVVYVSVVIYLDLLANARHGQYPELEFVGSTAGLAAFVTLFLMLNFAAYLISLKENTPGADRTNNRIITTIKLFWIPFFVHGITRRVESISPNGQKYRSGKIVNKDLLNVLLVGMFALISSVYQFGIKYRPIPLQSHDLAIVETNVERVRSVMLKAFEDNGVKLRLVSSRRPAFNDDYLEPESVPSHNAAFRDGHAYSYRTGKFKVSVRADYDNNPPRVSIASYPARFGLKEYDSINDRFEAIVDGLVQSGLFQLESSFFNEDYPDPQSAIEP